MSRAARASLLVALSFAASARAEDRPVALDAPVEVTVSERRSASRQLQESAEAVTVVDLRQAKQQSADLGEVLARTQGVSVRRTGGLGSESRLALNGLQGEQVRVFVDGVPIELSGYASGFTNIPVNIVERVEVYRGVVPARFGLDALGGLINVVTSRGGQSYVSGSYQAGSYGVHRVNAAGRYQHRGYFIGGNALLDLARNDYVMSDRLIANPDGSSTVRDVRRFHDGYRSYGGQVELGAVDKPWARRLTLRAFASAFEKDLQTNPVMTIVYGEVTDRANTYGASFEYELSLLPKLDLELLVTYAHRETGFRDVSRYRYSWTGQIDRLLATRPGDDVRGEIDANNGAYDTVGRQHLVLARVGLIAPFSAQHIARLYLTPQYATRRNHSFVARRRDENPNGQLMEFVAGLEYEQTLLKERLSNVVLAKYYLLQPVTETRVSIEGVAPYIAEQRRTTQAWGAGDALRYRFTSWLLAKASYEYTARLPTPDELFGNGVLIQANTALKPERSHNFNLGPRLEKRHTSRGDLVLDINAFWRETKDQIVLIATENSAPYRNIADARTRGVEGSLGWQSPGQWVLLDTTVTRMDSRNVAKDGIFAPFNGQRIPSRPYRLASWGARFRVRGLPKLEDNLDLFYYGRYTHGFYRGWANLGNPAFKMSVPNQTSHAVGATYQRTFRDGRFSFTFEVDNVADAELYDNWGVQRPGRSFHVKVTGQL